MITPTLRRFVPLFPIAFAAAAATSQIGLTPVGTAADYSGFLRIANIAGDSRAPGRSGWFDISEFQVGAKFAVATTTPAPISSTLTVRGNFAAATPALFLAACTMPLQPTVQLDMFAGGISGTLVLQVVLTNARLLQTEGKGQGLDTSQLEFDYETITWTWKRAGGDVTYTFDTQRQATTSHRLPSNPPAVAKDGDRYVALMQIANVNGGATKPGYVGWIPVSDLDSLVQRTVPMRATRTVADASMALTAFPGPALPLLQRNALTAHVHPEIKVHLFRTLSDPTPFLELRILQTRFDTVVQHLGPTGGSATMTLIPATMEWTFVDPSTGQRTTRCWDFVMQRTC